MNIRILHNRDIDRAKWNHLVEQSSSIQIYNSSRYLDCLCPDWKAIIINDYETVLALPVKKKFGIEIFANPPFLQKLSILGDLSISKLNLINQKLHALKLVRLSLEKRYFNDFPNKARSNFVIDLSNTYEQLATSYKDNARKNIKKAKTYNLKVVEDVDYNTTIKDFLESYQHLNQYKEVHVAALKLFLSEHKDCYDCYGVVLNDDSIIYSVIILKDANRYYYLISGAQQANKKYKATYFFIDWFMQHKSNQKNLIFDFEGSDVESIAYYYKGYGAKNEGYIQYENNKYGFPFKQIINKKLNL